nr:hypothetical protein [Paraburkholderia kururiensis]
MARQRARIAQRNRGLAFAGERLRHHGGQVARRNSRDGSACRIRRETGGGRGAGKCRRLAQAGGGRDDSPCARSQCRQSHANRESARHREKHAVRKTASLRSDCAGKRRTQTGRELKVRACTTCKALHRASFLLACSKPCCASERSGEARAEAP